MRWISRARRFAATLFVTSLCSVACACDDGALPPPPGPSAPPAPEYLSLTVGDVAGCYELLSLEWSPAFRGGGQWEPVPPRFFAFTSEMPRADTRYLIRPREPQDGVFFNTWRLISDNAVLALWSNGFSGVEITARRGSTDGRFYGQVRPISDTGSPPNRGTAVFASVPCWPDPE